MCETCQNWARADILSPYKIRRRDGTPLVTNHHPNCPHYNDSLMDVWKVTLDGQICYADNDRDANDTASDEWGSGDTISIVKERMHREVFENLPEFEGF
jgi:hypothetical protein